MLGLIFKNAKRGAPLLLLTAAAAALLAGCGGGGGNGNLGGGGGTTGTGSGTNGSGSGGVTLNASLIGKVTDTQGNGVAGATVVPDTGGVVATTLAQGGYRIDNITGNIIHKITAAVQQGGTSYSGSTQVFTESNALVSNANIMLSPTGKQVSINGTVRDSSGNAVAAARVFLVLPNSTANNASTGNYSSLIAFTDGNGAYTLTNVPSDLPSTTPAAISASASGFANSTATLSAFQAGGIYRQDFTLGAAPTQNTVGAPTIVAVTTATEPTDAQSGRLLARAAAGAPASVPASVYDQLRRLLSPAYARTAGRTPATGHRRVAHALGDYAIETDLDFTNPVQTGSILGYNVYRIAGTTAPAQDKANYYDFLEDALANYYADLTFSTFQSTTVASVPYTFALSATNTTSDSTSPSGVETALSPALTITPLSLLTLNVPQPGQTYTNPATISWIPVTGAQRYYVFIYSQYPGVGINPIFSSPSSVANAIPATASTYKLTTLPPGLDYYAIVVGAADQNETPNGPATTISNAALTFSQITRFRVQ
jgi:hypothetical protein